MQGIEQQRQYTLTQHTTFLVVVRRNNEYTGLVTDKVRVQAVVVTQSSVTSRVEYEQHFGTRVPEPASVATDETPSTGFILALSIGIPVLLLLSILLFYIYRSRQRSLTASTNAPILGPKSFTNSSKRSRSSTSLRSNSRFPNAPPTRLSPPEENLRARATEGTTSPVQIPQRSDTGTPIAELLTPITSNNRPQKRRSTLPPLPRLKIERVNTRRTSRQFSQILCTPDTLVSCLTPVAPSNELSRHKPIDSSFYRSTAAAAAGPLSPLSPVGPSLSTVAASVISHPSTRHAKPNFPYGYQSEYPEAIESGPSIPPPAALGPAERQREIQFLAEEERLIRQRVRATEELIRLRNEEARILDRKKQLGIGR